MDRSVESTQVRVQHRPYRPRLGGAARPDHVDYYGQPTPLKQLATINVPEPRMLTVQPFDPELGQGDRAGDPGVGARPDPVERRQGDPPPDPATHRGAAQGARQDRPPDRRGRPDRDPKRPARRDKHLKDLKTRARSARTTSAVRRIGSRSSRTSTRAGSTTCSSARKPRSRRFEFPRNSDRLFRRPVAAPPGQFHDPSRSSWTATAAGRLPAACRGRGRSPRGDSRARAAPSRRAIDLGIESLTVYAFSTENWRRPPPEVDSLMEIFDETIDRELPDLASRACGRASSGGEIGLRRAPGADGRSRARDRPT